MNRNLRFLLLFLIVALPVTASNNAAIGQDSETPQRTVLEVSPAKVPNPPLKYRLLPGYGECKPGNAAVYYGKVTAEQMGTYGNREYMKELRTFQELPIKERMKSTDLNKFSQTPGYYMLRAGALCDGCDWQIPIRDQNVVMVLLPEVQQARMFQWFMSLQAIAQIRDKNTDGAIETMQTGFALARNVGKAPLLVNGLVAVASVEILREPLELLIEQPETPSLYWALAWMPRPFVDLRQSLEAESDLLLRKMPGFDQLDSPATDAEFWNGQFKLAVESIRATGSGSGKNPDEMPSTERLLNNPDRLAIAKKLLVESGIAQSEVDGMPIGKALLLADRFEFVRQSQKLACIAALPWWTLTDAQMESTVPETTGLTNQLWFASGQVLKAHVRTTRLFNALQTIEGLRHFAATHDGKLPDSLDEMTETPAPLDPVTGKPFEYLRDGNTVLIDGPDLDDRQPFGYEIRFRK